MKISKTELSQVAAAYTVYQQIEKKPISSLEFLANFERNLVEFNEIAKTDSDELVLPNSKVEKVLKDFSKKAKAMLADKDALDEFLEKLSKKIKLVPKYGDKLACAVDMAMLINDFVRGDYTEVPMKTIEAVLGALIYFVSPVDFIPDSLVGVGYIDDAMVLGAAYAATQSDIQKYLSWRQDNKKKTAKPKESKKLKD